MNGQPTGDNAVLELKNISKSFPGVKALDHVSLFLNSNSVLALVGENGAGKSTLIKIITGVYTPDEGEMFLKGAKISFTNTQDAFAAGISAVHQERNIIETFSVAENILLEQITRKVGKWNNIKKIYHEAEKYLDLVGLDVSPRENVCKLKSGQQQLLEIARALSSNAHIVMLDEPTASISVKEADVLLERVDKLRKQGYAFIYVSHKLEEIFQIADMVCVVRDGKNAGEVQQISQFDRDKLITQMVGREESRKVYPLRDKTDKPVVLEAKDIVSRGNETPCSFSLHKGEILGWYGLVGAGRTELAHELIGVDPVVDGSIEIDGKTVLIKNTFDSLERHGIAYLSENRSTEGLFLSHSVKTNISSSVWKKHSARLGFVDQQKEREVAEKFKTNLQIKTPSLEQITLNLSGGNRQKVSIAKGLAIEPEFLIFDEPTVGIDIKTKEEIHDIIWNLAENGMSVIVIMSDMSEIIKLADRIMVFNQGAICGELLNTKDYSKMSVQIMDLIVRRNEAEEA